MQYIYIIYTCSIYIYICSIYAVFIIKPCKYKHEKKEVNVMDYLNLLNTASLAMYRGCGNQFETHR